MTSKEEAEPAPEFQPEDTQPLTTSQISTEAETESDPEPEPVCSLFPDDPEHNVVPEITQEVAAITLTNIKQEHVE